MGYRQSHKLQLDSVAAQLAGVEEENIYMVEHPPVFTLGRNGSTASLLLPEEKIMEAGVEIVATERGGDITYHGPGQLVVYPILNLRKRKIAVSEFISMLEDVMLATATDYGVLANRDARNRGIWVGNRKLGSVGIRIRHGISFHGLALNVALSLEHFRWIQPCGLSGVQMTMLSQQSRQEMSVEEVKSNMRGHIIDILAGDEEVK
ncbi:unnamed protein product [Cyprideis torosa]|uniref:Octanoyl-[acyl-carrier-protein]:protein N-octanoyltransferase LIPT2, mitochondrial n=1 Tax=Cyprideis torosa TaxID=163714 RepID=A0A7R8X1C6_9CRUS|nr:unnamed protein product [Cyprideis torosa]CAG0911236.1 unnamed protein product [Cyprideis torosa]